MNNEIADLNLDMGNLKYDVDSLEDDVEFLKEKTEEDNVPRDQIALQSFLRVAALEKTLIEAGIIKEDDLVKNLGILANDLVSVIEANGNQK